MQIDASTAAPAALPARPRAFDLAPRSPRRATVMDRVRVRAFARRLEAGEDEVDAFWAVASDPGTGYQQFRGAGVRPPEIVLRRKLASLLERTSPGIVTAARDVALTRLSALSDDAVRAVAEVVGGDFGDGQAARARLDAARIILGSIGVREQAASATANVQINVANILDRLGRPGDA